MPIEFRPIVDAELRDWLDALSTGFLERPDLDKLVEEVRPIWDLRRNWAAFDGELIAGTTRTWPTELTVPGGAQVAASAVAAVTVRPTHRRRGLLRGMLAAEHAAARERGEVVSLLYASEYPIYGRFGYGSAVQSASWRLDLTATQFHPRAGGLTGSIESVPIDGAALDLVRDVYERWRLTQPGAIWRRPVMWQEMLGLGDASAWGERWKGFLVVHRDDGGAVDGYAAYRNDPKWEHRQPRNTLLVAELVGLSSEAEVALWRFLASVDLVTALTAERRTPTDRLRWLLTNARAAEPLEPGDGMWLKLHDIAAALEARTYERAGSLVVETLVRDAGEPDDRATRVRLALDASPDGARAVATDRSPDLTVDAAALGAAYLGGTRLRDAVIAAGWDEHRAGALDAADALLATRDAPWCSTFF
jgi:predicted acetyltransferase